MNFQSSVKCIKSIKIINLHNKNVQYIMIYLDNIIKHYNLNRMIKIEILEHILGE